MITEFWVHTDNFNPADYFGFVYIIKNKNNNKIYVGKKVFWNNVKTKLTKKELAEQIGPGRKPTTKITQKESNWKLYWGSSKDLTEDLKTQGTSNFEKNILKLCKTKKEINFFEMYYQCKYDVLTTSSYNDNILGKFYRKDFL